MVHQIESGLYKRQALAIKTTNFKERLLSPLVDFIRWTDDGGHICGNWDPLLYYYHWDTVRLAAFQDGETGADALWGGGSQN